MTCYDCIHYEHCKTVFLTDKTCWADGCEDFKNKADFVEVVRCEKCKYGDVSIISKAKGGEETIACYCNLKNRVTDINSYCPSGERSKSNRIL